VEGCREPVVGGVESIQLVRIHEISGCRRNIFNFLHSFRPTYFG
jgi:hypothetical protein